MHGKRFPAVYPVRRVLILGITTLLLASLGAGWAVAKSGGLFSGKAATGTSKKRARPSLQRIGISYRLPARKERPRREQPPAPETTPQTPPSEPAPQNIVARAIWTAPTNAIAEVPLTLNGSASQGNAPLQCTWSFEDQSGATVWETHVGCELPFTFQMADTKYVKLTVRDADGEVNSNRKSFVVSSPAPPADTTPPETTITAQPSANTTETSASFSFSSSEPGSTFACKLDAGSWSSCTSPKGYSSLSTGSHTFSVRGTDGAGNTDATPASATWTVEAVPDTTPPQTTITAQPPATTTSTTASFSFASDESGSTFACQLDAGSWGSCTSPRSYSGLSIGSHTFSVRATDGAGNTDATPASATWTVEAASDTTPPETTITAHPSANTTETSASFSFSSSEPGSTFACKLDAGSWSSCTSPKGYSSLSTGSHTFSVRGTDGAGNTDATPASATWTVEAAASPGTHCFSSPHACGYPDETNTGASGTLTPSGSITVSTNGATVKDKEVSGKITINASNVTIENVKIVPTATGADSQAISNNGSGNVIRYVTAGGKGTGSNTIEAAVRGFNGVTLERDYFYNCNECVQGGGTIKDTYMVVSSIYSGAHAEDIYICSDTVTVEHSTLINSVNQTATVFGDTICGGGNKYTVKNSLLAGSGYVFYPQANNTNPPGAQTTITNNRIARCLGTPETKEGGHWYCKGGSDSSGIYPYGGSYGIGAYFSGPTIWSGNVWDDNLATIPEP